jgi:hypothetical protein
MKTIQSLAASVLVMASLFAGTAQARPMTSPSPAAGGHNTWMISLLPRQAKVESMAKAPAIVRQGDYFVVEVTSDTYGFSTVEVMNQQNHIICSIPVTLDKGVNHIRVAVKDLNDGVYFLRVRSDKGNFIRTFDVR